jgi:hypothetical protein
MHGTRELDLAKANCSIDRMPAMGTMGMNGSDQSEPRGPLPTQETQQPDPMLQMSAGHVGAGGITLFALVSAIVLSIVFYGLNAGRGPEQTASTSPAHSSQPAAGENSGATKPGTTQSNEHGGNG